ncbi:hypothetical protein PVAR5_2852 [Paecilomyces variotii No. 5]|uniref:Histidine-rich glycoprotein n=1 Tax=Byssochlamys spectabilis (strain No. 5 / NBRC 109023) TaxID=1356009 RepID=V5FQG0_BYSSN|nr:hypothetical protein PVAR5_2852 [Paecilomyces variotii No. 5]
MARLNQPTLLSLLGLFLSLVSQSNAAPAPRVNGLEARDVNIDGSESHHGYPPFPPTLKVREEESEGSVDNNEAPHGWFYEHSLDDSVSQGEKRSTDVPDGRTAVFMGYREPLERRGWFYDHSLDDSVAEGKKDSTDVPKPIVDYSKYPEPRGWFYEHSLDDSVLEDETDSKNIEERSDDSSSYHHHPHHPHHPRPPHHPPTLAVRSEAKVEGDEHHPHHHHHHPPNLDTRSEHEAGDDEHHRHHHHHHHPRPPHHPPTLDARSDEEAEGDEHHPHHHHHHHHPPTLAVRSEHETEDDEHHRHRHHHHHHHPPALQLETRNDKEDLKWPPPPPPGIGYPPEDKAVAGESEAQEINARGEDDAQDPEFYIPPNCHEYGCPP